VFGKKGLFASKEFVFDSHRLSTPIIIPPCSTTTLPTLDPAITIPSRNKADWTFTSKCLPGQSIRHSVEGLLKALRHLTCNIPYTSYPSASQESPEMEKGHSTARPLEASRMEWSLESVGGDTFWHCWAWTRKQVECNRRRRTTSDGRDDRWKRGRRGF